MVAVGRESTCVADEGFGTESSKSRDAHEAKSRVQMTTLMLDQVNYL